MNPTVIFFVIYAALASALVGIAYFIGSFVERAFGSETSMIAFLAMFLASLIGAFPIAFRLTPHQPDEGLRTNR